MRRVTPKPWNPCLKDPYIDANGPEPFYLKNHTRLYDCVMIILNLIFNFCARLPELGVISFNIMILIRISSISIYEVVKSWHIKRVKYNPMVVYDLESGRWKHRGCKRERFFVGRKFGAGWQTIWLTSSEWRQRGDQVWAPGCVRDETEKLRFSDVEFAHTSTQGTAVEA